MIVVGTPTIASLALWRVRITDPVAQRDDLELGVLNHMRPLPRSPGDGAAVGERGITVVDRIWRDVPMPAAERRKSRSAEAG